MAASMRNISRNLSRFQLASLCRGQTTRSLSSKATGDVKAAAEPSKKTPPEAEAVKPAPAASADTKPAASDSAPYSYEVPKYDDLLFYTVESDMSKYRIPQPSSKNP